MSEERVIDGGWMDGWRQRCGGEKRSPRARRGAGEGGRQPRAASRAGGRARVLRARVVG